MEGIGYEDSGFGEITRNETSTDVSYENFFNFGLKNVPESTRTSIVKETKDFFERNVENREKIKNTFDSLQRGGNNQSRFTFESLGLSIREHTFGRTSAEINEKLYIIPFHEIFPFYLSLGNNKEIISKYNKFSLQVVEYDFRELSTSKLLRNNYHYTNSNNKVECYPLLIYLDKVAIASRGRLIFDFQVAALPGKLRQSVCHIVTFACTSQPCIDKVGIDAILGAVVNPILDVMKRKRKKIRFMGFEYHLNIFPLAFLGDNDELQYISGCRKNFNNFKRRISRFCLCPKESFYDFNDICTERTKKFMIEMSSIMEDTKAVKGVSNEIGIIWGIDHNPRSLFSIPYLQYPHCLPPDIAHDVLEGMGAREVDSNILNQIKKKSFEFGEFLSELSKIVKKFELYRFGKFTCREKILSFYDKNGRNPYERCQYSAGVSYVMFQMCLFIMLKLNPRIDLEDIFVRRYVIHRDILMELFSRNRGERSVVDLRVKITQLFKIAKVTYREFLKLHHYKAYPKMTMLYGGLVDIMLLVHETKNKILKNLYHGGPNVSKTILMQSALQLKHSFDNPKSDIRTGRGVEFDRELVNDKIQRRLPHQIVFTKFSKIYLFNLPIERSVIIESENGIFEVEEIYRGGFLDDEKNDLVFLCKRLILSDFHELVPYKFIARRVKELEVVVHSDVSKVMYKDLLKFDDRDHEVVFLVFDKSSSLFVNDSVNSVQ